MIRSFLKNNEGATAIEYGLICAVIILVMIVGLSMTSTSLNNRYNNISEEVDQVM
jgi:pilus assembly protein Flp/PilA